jgi:hypothetical protein
MSIEALSVVVLGTTAAVAITLFIVMWHERRSGREAAVALVSGGVIVGWAVMTTILASRGFFVARDTQSAPPVGIDLAVVLVGLGVSLAASPSLRRLLSNQKNVIRLNVWRLVGIVFLMLMANGQMPALWALPTGIGDVIVGAIAFWIAGQLDSPNGKRRAILFNVFGLLDLIVAVGLGVTTSPGPVHVFHTTPTSELATRFPLVLVPTFLVPLAVMLHIISLWHMFGERGRDPRPH